MNQIKNNNLLTILSQFIYNKILIVPSKGILNIIILKVLEQIRLTILKFDDSLIKYKIGDHFLILPFSHNLPLYTKYYPYYSLNIGRIAKIVKETYDDLTIIDVGANVGDSIAIIKKEVDCPLFGLEADDYFFNILEKNCAFLPNVYIEKAYLGDKMEHLKLKLQENRGTAHLCKDAVDYISITTLTKILETYPDFSKSKLLKIDTDGFDCIILRGSLDYLIAAKPVIFFEYDPFFLSKQNDDGISIFNLLNSIGYKKGLVYDNFGEYMLPIDLTDLHLIEDIHNYISDRGGHFYYDICVFHNEDIDLFEKFRLQELQFFKNRND